MEDSIPNELMMVNNINPAMGDVEAFLNMTDHPGTKSFTVLQGANLNGLDGNENTFLSSNGIIYANCESSSEESAMHHKKPCPLEMSIKAANLDSEFERDAYFADPALELQPSITTYETYAPAAPVHLVGQEKQMMGIPNAPLQVVLVQFQPGNMPEPNTGLVTSVEELGNPPVVQSTNRESLICEVDDDDVSQSSVKNVQKSNEESLILKFRKVPSKNNDSSHKRVRKLKTGDWSDSDDDSLASIAKRKRLDKCCSRHCYSKISLKKQRTAWQEFSKLELLSMGDLYLIECLRAIDKQNRLNVPPLSPWSNSDEDITEEIAHESNGNQTLSDEIQNAIKESLKDQKSTQEELSRPDWQYSIVIHNRSRKVCLKFLLSALEIPESRLTDLKNKILNGEVLDRSPVTELRNKYTEVWEMAKRHLDTVSCTPLPYCKAVTPHLSTLPIEWQQLYQKFHEYYLNEKGETIELTFPAYEKFLKAQRISYIENKTCNACETSEIVIKQQRPKKKNPAQRGDVFSLMLNHLSTIPCKIPIGCTSLQPHKFFSPSAVTIPMLYEEYRKYFLKETNSELGLRFAIYESLLLRNPCFTIADLDETSNDCPQCISVTTPVSHSHKSHKTKKQKDRKKKKKKSKTTNGR